MSVYGDFLLIFAWPVVGIFLGFFVYVVVNFFASLMDGIGQ